MKNHEQSYQSIADMAHFARMELLACGATERLEKLILEIRTIAMEQVYAIETENSQWSIK